MLLARNNTVGERFPDQLLLGVEKKKCLTSLWHSDGGKFILKILMILHQLITGKIKLSVLRHMNAP